MKVHHFNNAQLYERVKNYLLQHEADHNLILAITDNIIHSPEHFTQQPYLVAVEDETILAVALRTPPRKLILSRAVNTEAIALIAQHLYSHSQPLYHFRF